MAHLALAAFLLLSGAAYAHTVEGTVREKGTRRAVPGALLFVVDGDAEAFSDERGRFFLSIGEVPKGGRLTIRVRSPGYEDEVLLVELEPKSTTDLDVYLTPAPEVRTTFVRERRSPAERARGTHRIEEREVNELPGTYGDPAKAIENFPGMGRVVRSQGALLVRGAAPEHTAVYVDDFEVPDLYHFTGSTSVINTPFVESVELVPGAFSARYGRATGGLVTLETRKLPTDDVHGFAKLDVIDGGAYVGVPLSEHAAVGVSARRSWLDVIRNAQRMSGGAEDEVLVIPTYWDWQLKLDWDVTPGHELIVFAFGSGDRQLDVLDGPEPYARTDESDFARVSMRYRHGIGSGFTHTFTPVVGWERRTLDEQGGLRHADRQTLDVQLRDELSWRDEKRRIMVGVDATLRADFFRYGGLLVDEGLHELPSAVVDEVVTERRIDDRALRATVALYAEGTFQPLERLSLTPGLRLDGYWLEEAPRISIEPRFAGSFEVLPGDFGLSLRGGAGVFAQPPPLEDVAAARRFGRVLAPTSAMHVQGGFEQHLGALGTLSTTTFVIWRDHILERSEAFPLPAAPFASPVSDKGSQMSMGLEVLLRLVRSERFFAWLSYAVSRHERLDGLSDTAVPYPYPASGDTTHLLTALGQVTLPLGFRVGARYRVATGMPFTEVAGSLFDADAARYEPVFGPKHQGRYPTFHALDLRVDWAWLLPWFEVDVYVDLGNVLNIRVEEGRVYAYDYERYTPLLGLPTIPAVGVKVTF